MLRGVVPSSFSSLISLKRLEIQGNNFSGEFPDLSSLKKLYFLDASDNKFSGHFPSTFAVSLVEISMRNNNLRGDLQENIGNLEYLQVLDLRHNRLSGPILSVLFNHPSLQQLTLSYNNFSYSQVPGRMGLNSKLIAVDLSYNNLQGLLPSFLGSMPKLSAVSLEHNKFTGMIPTLYLFGPIPSLLKRLRPGSADISLVDNCLYRCPDAYFFCQGRV